MTVALEEKYDQVRQLIAMGKERGYLLYDEVNDILPPEVHSSDCLLYTSLGTCILHLARPSARLRSTTILFQLK